MLTPSPDRRSAIKALGTAGVLAVGTGSVFSHEDAPKIKGNIKQSVCRWCYGKLSLEKLATEAKKIGYQSIELLSPKEVLEVKKLGLTCALLGGADIARGLNRKEYHEAILKKLTDGIEFAAAEGVPSVICMSGNSNGLADDKGLEVCAEGLKKILGLAEKKKVTLIMEGLNSKVDHKDYMYDRTTWGVELCKKVGSDRFKLLYDIYHTGGNPGRNEIDETQELNYPAIIKAIVATGYTGYLGQEFIPKREPLASLAQAFRLCDV
jgi:hydroxypyruvate isomerase